MVETVKGDLIKAALSPSDPLNVIIHGCNSKGVMGAGIAKQIKDTFYDNFINYRDFCMHSNRLGQVYLDTFEVPNKGEILICNAITQEGYGRGENRYVSYDAVDSCMKTIAQTLRPDYVIGYPLIGAGLGGGNWNVIKEIIHHNLEGFNHKLYVL